MASPLAAPLYGPQVAGKTALRPEDLTRLALAQQLLKSGTDASPVESPWQGAARLGQALAGGYMNYRLGQEQKTREGETAATMAQALRATKGSWTDPDTGQAMPIPNAQGGLEGAMAVLAGNPETAGQAAQLGFSQIGKQQELANALLKDKGLVQGPGGVYQNAPGYAEAVAGAAGQKKGAEEKAALPYAMLKDVGGSHVLGPGAQQHVNPIGAALANQALGVPDGQAGPIKSGVIATNTTPPPSTSVTVHAGQSLADSASKDVIESLRKGAETAKNSVTSINTTGVLRDLLNKGVITGTGAEAETAVRGALNKLGITNDPKVPATQALVGAVGQLVMSKVKNLGSGAGITEKDVKFTERVVGGDITADERAIRMLLDINERADRHILESHGKAVKHALSGPGPLRDPIIQHMLKGFDVQLPQSYTVPGVTPQSGAGGWSIRQID